MKISKEIFKLSVIGVLFLSNASVAYSQKIKPLLDSLPSLPASKTRLFYLQRTIDRNAVIYELNYDEKDQVNEKNPVKIYWLEHSSGKTKTLTYAQNKFAYGIESELIDAEKKVFRLTLMAYKKIYLYLQPDKNKHYEVFTAINEKPSVLNRIIVTITGGTYLKPIVSHIELIGIELKTGEKITEKILIQ